LSGRISGASLIITVKEVCALPLHIFVHTLVISS
jgi:hypothetical protein